MSDSNRRRLHCRPTKSPLIHRNPQEKYTEDPSVRVWLTFMENTHTHRHAPLNELVLFLYKFDNINNRFITW